MQSLQGAENISRKLYAALFPDHERETKIGKDVHGKSTLLSVKISRYRRFIKSVVLSLHFGVKYIFETCVEWTRKMRAENCAESSG